MSRSYSFLSAIERAAAERTSTRQSSISWMISRAIFSGSSALSSIALMFELMMSDSREKTPISEPFVVSSRGVGLLDFLQCADEEGGGQKRMRATIKPARKKPQLSNGLRPSQLPKRPSGLGFWYGSRLS